MREVSAEERTAITRSAGCAMARAGDHDDDHHDREVAGGDPCFDHLLDTNWGVAVQQVLVGVLLILGGLYLCVSGVTGKYQGRVGSASSSYLALKRAGGVVVGVVAAAISVLAIVQS